MEANSVCAVIVTYHPEPDVLENLAKARPQVEGMVVVDNGSTPEELAPFRPASQTMPFALIENGDNLGIATALNQGIRWARQQGFQWVILFDQDSTTTDGMVAAMLKEHAEHPQKEKIAIFMPKHINRKTGNWQKPSFGADGNPLVAMTSGSLIPVSIFDTCGWFEDDLIIDCVDTEYGLRIRQHGYTIALCPSAVLHHAVGHPRVHTLLGVRLFSASHHSALRRYFITRNHLTVIGRYRKQYPAWCRKMINIMIRDTLKIVLVEEGRWKKIGYTVRGAMDAIKGRLGKPV